MAAVLSEDTRSGKELLFRLAESGEAFHWSALHSLLGHLLASGPLQCDGFTMTIEIEAWGTDV
jgi:hypothetical protein